MNLDKTRCFLRIFSCRQRVFCATVLIVLLTLVPSVIAADTNHPPSPNEIAFMTDFGSLDDSVAICRQVMYNIDPTVRILDITHEVTPFSIVDGARYIMGTTPYVPRGTVFVVVIDPGVGSSRKAIVAKSKKGNYYVLPDNGLLTYVQDLDGIEAVRVISNPKWMIQDAISSTFHGRDIFSPVGAHLANGEDWSQVGPVMPVDQLVRLSLTQPTIENGVLKAQIVGVDGPFGNLVTNVAREEFEKLGYKWGDTFHLALGAIEMDMPFTHTFSDVEIGKPLAFIDSRGRLSFSLNQTNFARTYNIKAPVNFNIPAKGKK